MTSPLRQRNRYHHSIDLGTMGISLDVLSTETKYCCTIPRSSSVVGSFKEHNFRLCRKTDSSSSSSKPTLQDVGKGMDSAASSKHENKGIPSGHKSATKKNDKQHNNAPSVPPKPGNESLHEAIQTLCALKKEEAEVLAQCRTLRKIPLRAIRQEPYLAYLRQSTEEERNRIEQALRNCSLHPDQPSVTEAESQWYHSWIGFLEEHLSTRAFEAGTPVALEAQCSSPDSQNENAGATGSMRNSSPPSPPPPITIEELKEQFRRFLEQSILQQRRTVRRPVASPDQPKGEDDPETEIPERNTMRNASTSAMKCMLPPDTERIFFANDTNTMGNDARRSQKVLLKPLHSDHNLCMELPKKILKSRKAERLQQDARRQQQAHLALLHTSSQHEQRHFRSLQHINERHIHNVRLLERRLAPIRNRNADLCRSHTSTETFGLSSANQSDSRVDKSPRSMHAATVDVPLPLPQRAGGNGKCHQKVPPSEPQGSHTFQKEFQFDFSC